MNTFVHHIARGAVVVASLMGVCFSAHAQTKTLGQAGAWSILHEPGYPESCRAIMTNPGLQPDFGNLLGLAFTGDRWEIWTDYRIYNPMPTVVLIDGRAFPATFEQNESVAIAPVGLDVIEAINAGRDINLNLDPTGPAYSLRGASRAISMLESCAQGASAQGASAQTASAGIDWVRLSGGALDRRAQPSGRDSNGAPLFVCSADFNNVQQPGKIRRGFDGCNFGYGGQELTSGSYSLMVGTARWAYGADGSIPPDAIQAGSEMDGRPLFVCRTTHNGSLQIGKIRPGFRGCNFGYGGAELTGNPYEVMH